MPPENQKSLTPAAKPNDLLAAQGKVTGGKPAAAEPVTYMPRDGDPSKIKWGGKVFHANVAQQIDNPILLTKARSNKWFHVGEGAPVVAVEETIEPKTPEQYRTHVVAWLKTVETVTELEKKWADEERLRMTCGVGGEDLDLLAAAIRPRRAQLALAGLPT